MNNLIKTGLAVVLLLLCCNHHGLLAQKRNKRTSKREIRKRQEEANKKSEYNKFNELQPMGYKASQTRTDYIWSYETAQTVPQRAGDVSIFTPSRFSTRNGTEFGTSFGGLPFVPAFYFKKRWTQGKLYMASRHQLYSYGPTLYWAKEMELTGVFPLDQGLPVAVALKNELILSKPFLKDLKCGSVKQAFIIITAALAYDYGFVVEQTDVQLMQPKLLRQRSNVILGGGDLWSARLQGDFYLTKNLYATLAVRGLHASGVSGNSLEQNASVRIVMSPRFSLSAGYWLTFGKGTGTPILPMVDLTYHFGNKQERDKGLFGR